MELSLWLLAILQMSLICIQFTGTYNNIYLPETSAETGRWQDTPDEGLQLPEVDTDTPAADSGRTLVNKQS